MEEKNQKNQEGEIKIPEGAIVTEDGCICPPPAVKKPCKNDLETCPYDPRFPNANQTRHCYLSFIDYQRCARLLGDYPGCLIFWKCWRALCPSSWTERWYEQMEKGTFPRKIYPCKPIVRPNPNDLCKTDDDEEEVPQEPIC